MGAWIETLGSAYDSAKTACRPLVWGRGLKHSGACCTDGYFSRPLVWGRGLKHQSESFEESTPRRPLVWGRGLKLMMC